MMRKTGIGVVQLHTKNIKDCEQPQRLGGDKKGFSLGPSDGSMALLDPLIS